MCGSRLGALGRVGRARLPLHQQVVHALLDPAIEHFRDRAAVRQRRRAATAWRCRTNRRARARTADDARRTDTASVATRTRAPAGAPASNSKRAVKRAEASGTELRVSTATSARERPEAIRRRWLPPSQMLAPRRQSRRVSTSDRASTAITLAAAAPTTSASAALLTRYRVFSEKSACRAQATSVTIADVTTRSEFNCASPVEGIRTQSDDAISAARRPPTSATLRALDASACGADTATETANDVHVCRRRICRPWRTRNQRNDAQPTIARAQPRTLAATARITSVLARIRRAAECKQQLASKLTQAR